MSAVATDSSVAAGTDAEVKKSIKIMRTNGAFDYAAATASARSRVAAAMEGKRLTSAEFAAELDAEDGLSALREDFHFPATPETAEFRKAQRGGKSIYLCGNSLGLQPKALEGMLGDELRKWREEGVEGHFVGKFPWVTIDEICVDSMAAVVGAKPVEVCLMNSLTVNLHLAMVSFYRPTRQRHKIVIEGKSFPSDWQAVRSQIRQRGFDPETSLVELEPREGESTLRTEDIEAAIAREGDSVALVMLSGVQYYTGQLFDIGRVTAAAHAVGALCGWDCAHAAGNAPLRLHEWGVDFAVWCTYKYLNSGPGGISGLFVHERHHRAPGGAEDGSAGASAAAGAAAVVEGEKKEGAAPPAGSQRMERFEGWWGHRKSDRFAMDHVFLASPGAFAWQ